MKVENAMFPLKCISLHYPIWNQKIDHHSAYLDYVRMNYV